MSTEPLWSIFLNAAIVNNFVLALFLGICPFLGVSSKLRTASCMGAATLFVMLICALCAWAINLALAWLGLESLRLIAFITVIASTVQLVEMVIRRFSPALVLDEITERALEVALSHADANPGTEVVAHCLSVELEGPDGHNDTMLDPEQRIWGFETNFGGLAQLALVKSNQLMPKPDHLTWEEAASPGLVNSTAYRQLVSRNGAGMKQGDNVLIWGASGGLGGFATQYALNGGATPVCVVSSEDKAEICRKMGVSEATYFRWRKKYAGLGISELRELRQVREENRKLKGIVADLTLDRTILQEALRKKW